MAQPGPDCKQRWARTELRLYGTTTKPTAQRFCDRIRTHRQGIAGVIITFGFLESHLERYGTVLYRLVKATIFNVWVWTPEALEPTNSPISAAVSAISQSRTHSPGHPSRGPHTSKWGRACRRLAAVAFSRDLCGFSCAREPQTRRALQDDIFEVPLHAPTAETKARICYRTESTVKHPSDDYIGYTVTVRDTPPLTVETAKPRMHLPLAPGGRENLEFRSLLGTMLLRSACKIPTPFFFPPPCVPSFGPEPTVTSNGLRPGTRRPGPRALSAAPCGPTIGGPLCAPKPGNIRLAISKGGPNIHVGCHCKTSPFRAAGVTEVHAERQTASC